MEDNSGLDLICARNSLSNGLLSETNPTLSNLRTLKVEQIIRTIVQQDTFMIRIMRKFVKCMSAAFLSYCLPFRREKSA